MSSIVDSAPGAPPISLAERTVAAHRDALALIGSQADLPAVAVGLAEQVRFALAADGASVAQIHGEDYEYLAGVGVAASVVGARRPLAGSFTGAVVASRTAKVFRVDRVSGASQKRGRSDGIRSGVLAPVLSDGEVVGTIGVASRLSDAFGAQDLAALADFAGFVGLAFSLASQRRELEQKQRAVAASERQLSAATRARDEFLSVVSHELRTPLNGILGFTDYALECVDDAEARHALGQVLEAARRLQLLVEDVLELTRLRSDGTPSRPAPFDTADLLERVSERFAPSAEAAGLQLEVQAAPGLPGTLVADVGQIEEVLRHLCTNAIKFTPRGKVRVSAGLGDLEGAPALELVIEDTGLGMSRETLLRAFNGMEQGDMSYTRCHGGLGLGLALTRGILAQLGGHMAVESSLGEGSQFNVLVPVGLRG